MVNPDRLYDWFAVSADRHGEACALEIGGAKVSYRQLADSATRAAAELRRRFRRPAPRIGLVDGHDLHTYLAYLAILQLGGTVVPLNPDWPPARCRALARAAGIDLLIDGTGVHDQAPARTSDAGEDAPAYILFTSGSTGSPKGVPISHGNISSFLGFCAERYRLAPGSRLSHTFDLTFDPSLFDLFAAWSAGATVVVPRRGEALRPVAYVNRRGITHWFSTPSRIAFAERSGELRPGCMPRLRFTMFGGDTLTARHARLWQAAAPAGDLENHYGPTEMTVFCVAYRAPRDSRDWPRTSNGTMPIGTVAGHLEHLVVDRAGRPAADGELLLRGPQRFHGYLDPSDNAGRFAALDAGAARTVPGGAAPDADAWYRTGDLVRTEGDVLVHAGRTDLQLKVRGYRVEPGEVEAALREHPAVEEAVVFLDDSGGGQDLAAVHTGVPVPGPELAEFAARRLAHYMVPTRYRHLRELPRNANLKLLRGSALRAALADGRAPQSTARVSR